MQKIDVKYCFSLAKRPAANRHSILIRGMQKFALRWYYVCKEIIYSKSVCKYNTIFPHILIYCETLMSNPRCYCKEKDSILKPYKG